MKKYLIFVVVPVVISCKSFNDFRAQEYTFNEFGKQNLLIRNNKPILEVTINNEKGYFLFDTGASGSLITDSTYLSKINTKDNLKKTRHLTNASGITLDGYKMITDEIKSEIFNSKKIIMSYYKISSKSNKVKNCTTDNSKNEDDGILGIDNFIRSDKTISLNFDNNTIEILNETCSKEGYVEIDADIDILNKKIHLPITLHNKKVKFLFDTGNNGNLIIKEQEFAEFTPDFEGEMLLGNFNGLSVQKIKSFQKIPVTNFYFPIEPQKVTSLNPFLTNSMGMKFIGKFNWLIDFKNRKIYIQKNKNPFESDANTDVNAYQVLVLDEKLMIGFKNSKSLKYNLNDEIISVNKEKITLANRCEMQKLLNSTLNWDEIEIEIKK